MCTNYLSSTIRRLSLLALCHSSVLYATASLADGHAWGFPLCPIDEQACESAGNALLQKQRDAVGRTRQVFGQRQREDEFTYEVTYWGHSYFVAPEPDNGLKSAFDRIADGNFWHSDESVSGPGSDMTMTAPVRKCLGDWIQEYSVKMLLDIPCGDANWQGQIPGLENVTYKGYDIADTPLQRAQERNSGNASMSFAHMDLTSEVPQEKADIIMLRDVIQHLPLQKALQMLLNAKSSGARYLAVSTFTDGKNIEVPPGGFYKNNVHIEPFGLPNPIEACQNYNQLLPQWQNWTSNLVLVDLSTWIPHNA